MSANRPRLKQAPCGLEPAEAIKRRKESLLAPFNRHKSALLHHLRNAHEHGIECGPFDAEKSWLDLTKLAHLHLGFEDSRKRISKLNPTKPLAELVKTLSRARALVGMASRDGGHGALLRAWRDETNMTMASALSMDEAGATSINNELAKAVRTLAKLESAASRATNDARRRNGRPKGPSKLPRLDVIIGLAAVYRRSAGLRPAAGDGLFAKFAWKCLTALGHSDIKYNSLVDATKRARHQARLLAAASNKSSPFA